MAASAQAAASQAGETAKQWWGKAKVVTGLAEPVPDIEAPNSSLLDSFNEATTLNKTQVWLPSLDTACHLRIESDVPSVRRHLLTGIHTHVHDAYLRPVLSGCARNEVILCFQAAAYAHGVAIVWTYGVPCASHIGAECSKASCLAKCNCQILMAISLSSAEGVRLHHLRGLRNLLRVSSIAFHRVPHQICDFVRLQSNLRDCQVGHVALPHMTL